MTIRRIMTGSHWPVKSPGRGGVSSPSVIADLRVLAEIYLCGSATGTVADSRHEFRHHPVSNNELPIVGATHGECIGHRIHLRPCQLNLECRGARVSYFIVSHITLRRYRELRLLSWAPSAGEDRKQWSWISSPMRQSGSQAATPLLSSTSRSNLNTRSRSRCSTSSQAKRSVSSASAKHSTELSLCFRRCSGRRSSCHSDSATRCGSPIPRTTCATTSGTHDCPTPAPNRSCVRRSAN